MKPLLLLTTLFFFTLSAARAQQAASERPVFGDIRLGDDMDSVNRKIEILCQKHTGKQKCYFSAEEIMASFVPMGFKDRLKFSSQNKKTRFRLALGSDDSRLLKKMGVTADLLPCERMTPSEYEKSAQEAYLLLAEIATTKFGQSDRPIRFPKMEELPVQIKDPSKPFAAAPPLKWQWTSGDLQITLRVWCCNNFDLEVEKKT